MPADEQTAIRPAASGRWLKHGVDLWSTSTVFIALLILVPLTLVLLGVFQPGPKWDHLADTVLLRYIGNTAILLVTVSILSLLMAVPQAWLVAAFDFPGRRLFEWALVMPLAVPTYVAAFAYYQLPESAIPLLIEIRKSWGVEAFLRAESILRYGLLSILLAGVLFPYIYVSARASFSQQRRAVIEAAQTLGSGPTRTFFTIALPLARPAIVAGLSLVLMEVVNDYGAVNFFGVPTLTEGIFRTWFGLEDRTSAVRLAGIVMTGLLIVLLLERLQRGRARFAEPSLSPAPLSRRPLRGFKAAVAFALCLVPLSLGLLFPLWRLITWASMTFDKVIDASFLLRMTHSLWLALGTALALAMLGVLFAYAQRLHPNRWLATTSRLATLGYAAPGAVVAVGVMITFGIVDRGLVALGDNMGLPTSILSGTLFAIAFAYIVRFLAVAAQPIRAGMDRVCGSLDEASRTLGHRPFRTLLHIDLPLLRGTLVAAAMLVFVDILKELPLTMILRPANFETLATTAFGYAKEGQIQESAVPSLMIIAAGGLGLIALNRSLRQSRFPTP